VLYYYIVTFKELGKIIAEKKKEIERESKLYNPNHYWEGRKVVSLNEWLKIKNNCGLKAALQYFPNDFPTSGFTFILYRIEDRTLKREAEQWRSDFIRLMEYSNNPGYGKWKCFCCLLSTDREEAGIFIGINKVISRALDTTADDTSVYPCKILNRFACPYDKKITVDGEEEEEEDITVDSSTKKLDVDYLFYLSELAFAVELALAKAQEEDFVYSIKSSEDAYQVLTDKETLEKVLQQGLKEEHMQYKDRIADVLTNMTDRIKVEDLRV
jgi:hypothetical protein